MAILRRYFPSPIAAVAIVTNVNVEKRRCALETICLRGDELVVKGDALLWVPTREMFET